MFPSLEDATSKKVPSSCDCIQTGFPVSRETASALLSFDSHEPAAIWFVTDDAATCWYMLMLLFCSKKTEGASASEVEEKRVVGDTGPAAAAAFSDTSVTNESFESPTTTCVLEFKAADALGMKASAAAAAARSRKNAAG